MSFVMENTYSAPDTFEDVRKILDDIPKVINKAHTFREYQNHSVYRQ